MKFRFFQAPLQLNPLQLINHIILRTKFLNSGIDLYKQIEKIRKEENVKAKYCPQWIPIWSIPLLSKSDFDKITFFSKKILINIFLNDEY